MFLKVSVCRWSFMCECFTVFLQRHHTQRPRPESSACWDTVQSHPQRLHHERSGLLWSAGTWHNTCVPRAEARRQASVWTQWWRCLHSVCRHLVLLSWETSSVPDSEWVQDNFQFQMNVYSGTSRERILIACYTIIWFSLSLMKVNW